MTFNCLNLWPFDICGAPPMRKRVIKYEGGLVSTFGYNRDLDAIEYRNIKDGQWMNSWFLQIHPGRGVAEVRDDYPISGVLGKLCGGIKKLCFDPAMYWGNYQKIGDVIQNEPGYKTASCCPPAFGAGSQTVTFEARFKPMKLDTGLVFDDAVQICCVQIWGKTTSWVRLWNAFGVGPIAYQFSEGAPRIEAKELSG